MISVVIAAHNEAAVIGRCLDLLVDSVEKIEVVVVPNGCTDATADRARRPGVTVIELAEPGKAGALNAGDAAAESFPRLYLDADMMLSAADVASLGAALERCPSALVAVPARQLLLDRRPILVRAYFAVQSRLPVYRRGLFGRGAVMISARGRQRFRAFPIETADDLFLDSLFGDEERVVVDDVVSFVEAPHRTIDLMRRLIRVRRGNAQLRRADLADAVATETTATVRTSDPWSWLRDVVVRRPYLAPAGAVYAVITVIADVCARRTSDGRSWGRDESTRSERGRQ